MSCPDCRVTKGVPVVGGVQRSYDTDPLGRSARSPFCKPTDRVFDIARQRERGIDVATHYESSLGEGRGTLFMFR